MVIFHSYVSLPEGSTFSVDGSEWPKSSPHLRSLWPRRAVATPALTGNFLATSMGMFYKDMIYTIYIYIYIYIMDMNGYDNVMICPNLIWSVWLTMDINGLYL